MVGTPSSGRPPKPTALHKLHGTRPQAKATRGRRRTLEPQPQGEVQPPDWLTPSVREHWDYALQHVPPGMWKALDQELLIRWVQTVERLRVAERAQETLNRQSDGRLPYLLRGKNGAEISPYVELIDRWTAQIMRLSDRLGFSPVSRPRIRLDDDLPAPRLPAVTEPAAPVDNTWGELKRFPVVQGGRTR
jgi:phage terminase small subunit